jgi:DNA modification methylase
LPEDWINKLYFGDNLQVLREFVNDEMFDLVCLDPPFNSNVIYNVLLEDNNGKSNVFDDKWVWNDAADASYQRIIISGNPKLAELVKSLQVILGLNGALAYIVMMIERLNELHRVLKSTGNIFLHCDPKMSHYLKFTMDVIFGAKQFQNEIIWHYRKWPSGKHAFQRNHDMILYYSKSAKAERVFNQTFMPRAASTLKRFGNSKIVSGRLPSGKRIPSQVEEFESAGVRQDDVWEIGRVPPVKQMFPTQKPDALLERIVTSASNEEQLVLDPFCGSGTTLLACERLKRRWVGIDASEPAIRITQARLKSACGEALSPYQLIQIQSKQAL